MEERKAKVINIEEKEVAHFEGGATNRTAVSKKGEGIDVTVHLANIKPGSSHDWHDHEQDEAMYILKGAGRYLLEDGELRYKAGDFVFMPKKTMHKNEVLSTEDVEIIAVFNPAEF